VTTAAGTNEVVCSFVLGAGEPRPGLAVTQPFPNPSPDGVRLFVGMDVPATVTLKAFDLRGHRVHGPVTTALAPGRRELSWNGLANGRPVPIGVYVLRLKGPGIELQRNVVLVRNRP
jgi:hypothetical protein